MHNSIALRADYWVENRFKTFHADIPMLKSYSRQKKKLLVLPRMRKKIQFHHALYVQNTVKYNVPRRYTSHVVEIMLCEIIYAHTILYE